MSKYKELFFEKSSVKKRESLIYSHQIKELNRKLSLKIFEAIKRGHTILRESGIKSYKIDSEILMSRVIKKNRADIILNLNKLLLE